MYIVGRGISGLGYGTRKWRFDKVVAYCFGLSLMFLVNATKGAVPTPSEILRACAANFAKLSNSRIFATAKAKESFRGRMLGDMAYTQSLYRSGNKLALEGNEWPISGLAHGVRIGSRIKDQNLWVGKVWYFVGRHGTGVTASFSRKVFRPWRDIAVGGFAIAPALGILNGDIQPFPSILQQADMESHVSRKMVVIGAYRCLHLVASGRAGNYSLWVVPACGYCIARAVVSKGAGNSYMGNRPLGRKPYYPKGWPFPKAKRTAAFRMVLDHVHIGRSGDFWYPSSFRTVTTIRSIVGDVDINTVLADVHRVLLTCSPADSAFTPDIPQGTIVDNMDDPAIQYEWHNGKVVPAYDKKGIKKINRDIDDLRRQGSAYFTAPIAASAGAAGTTVVGTAAAGRPMVDPVAPSTALWVWWIAAVVSMLSAALCILFVRKNNPHV